jgi:hypothetical protein
MKVLPFRNLKKVIGAILTFMPFISQSAIVTRTNTALNCQQYEVIYSDPENKRDFLAEALAQGAELFDNAPARGLSLVNLRIDFENKKATVDVRQHILFGFNRNLLTDVSIASGHPKLQEYVNRLNFDLFLSSSICVNSDKELIELR